MLPQLTHSVTGYGLGGTVAVFLVKPSLGRYRGYYLGASLWVSLMESMLEMAHISIDVG